MDKFSLLKMAFIVFVLCAATTIASPETTFETLGSFNVTDGVNPYPVTLVQGRDGNLYGTTLTGGVSGAGTVFKITPGGTLTTLYNFCSKSYCTDGAAPYAGLVLATNGNFYGTTTEGGAGINCPSNGCGTVFKLSPEPSGGCPSGSNAGNGWCETVLYGFCSKVSCTDGAYPYAALVQGTDGNFYGTTFNGGANNAGTVFKITPSGTLTTLHSFAFTDGIWRLTSNRSPSPLNIPEAAMTTETKLCKCGKPFLDHTIEEAVGCGIGFPSQAEYGQWLDLVCCRCGKKHRAHSLNELGVLASDGSVEL